VTDRLGRIIVRSGSDLPLNAKNKVTAAIHYEIALSSDMQIDFDGRYRWASKTYSDPANTPGFTNQPTSQLFLSSGVKGNWGTLTLFVDNVFDRDDTVAKYPPNPPLYTYSNYLRPRNFGLEFKRSF
jgi:outer membrane receptor for Fe3+-dicitrate